MKRNHRITNKDIFHFYPYKKNIETSGNTIPQPYVKKSDVISDHPLSLDYNDWISVVDDYIDLIILTLLRGKEFAFPGYIGKIQLRKYKTEKLINYSESTLQGKKVYYKNNDSYRIILKWYRDYTIARFHYKFHWKVRMAKKLGKSIHDSTLKNYNYVYNILDI